MDKLKACPFCGEVNSDTVRLYICEIENPNIRLPDCPLIEIKDGEEND